MSGELLDRRQGGFKANDREMLIRIDEKVARTSEEIRQINVMLAQLEAKKLDIKDGIEWRKDSEVRSSDHENRLRRLENWGAMAAGALALLQLALKFLV